MRVKILASCLRVRLIHVHPGYFILASFIKKFGFPKLQDSFPLGTFQSPNLHATSPRKTIWPNCSTEQVFLCAAFGIALIASCVFSYNGTVRGVRKRVFDACRGGKQDQKLTDAITQVLENSSMQIANTSTSFVPTPITSRTPCRSSPREPGDAPSRQIFMTTGPHTAETSRPENVVDSKPSERPLTPFAFADPGIARLSKSAIMQTTAVCSGRFHVGDAAWLKLLVSDEGPQSTTGRPPKPSSSTLPLPKTPRSVDTGDLQRLIVQGVEDQGRVGKWTALARLGKLRGIRNALRGVPSVMYSAVDTSNFTAAVPPGTLLGEGGYGCVYASRIANESVAVKLISSCKDPVEENVDGNVIVNISHKRRLNQLHAAVATREAAFGKVTNALIALGASCAFPIMYRSMAVEASNVRGRSGARLSAAAFVVDRADCTFRDLLRDPTTLPQDVFSCVVQALLGSAALAAVNVLHNDMYDRNILIKTEHEPQHFRYRILTCRKHASNASSTRRVDPSHKHTSDCYQVIGIGTNIGAQNVVTWIADFGLATGGGLGPLPEGQRKQCDVHCLHYEFSPPSLPETVQRKLDRAVERRNASRHKDSETHIAVLRSIAVSACEHPREPVHVSLVEHMPAWARDVYVIMLCAKRYGESDAAVMAASTDLLSGACLRWFKKGYNHVRRSVRDGKINNRDDAIHVIAHVLSDKFMRRSGCNELVDIVCGPPPSGVQVTEFDIENARHNLSAVEMVSTDPFA